MTIYLRNNLNQTLVDIEIAKDRGLIDLRSIVIINTYTDFLLQHLDKAESIKADFSEISELRRWLHEIYYSSGENSGEDFKDVIKEVTSFLNTIANKYYLHVITD